MPTITQVQTFTNSEGRTFAVRMLPVGARYGRNNSVQVTDDTLVEFYDTTHADDGAGGGDGFGLLGQFVSRYYAATLLGMDKYSNPHREGLCLDGGNPQVWSIDPATMDEVRAWIGQRFTILAIDGTTWHVDYHPVRCNGTIRNAGRSVPFRTVGTDAMVPPNETPDPALPAAVLDTVSAWLRVPSPYAHQATSYVDAIEAAAGHALTTASLDTARLVPAPPLDRIARDLATRLTDLAANHT